MAENIFVLGLDEGNAELLRRLPDAREYRFHPLLALDEVRIGYADFRDCLRRAQAELDRFDGPVDAITGYWDFPVTSLVPVLCDRFGLPSTTLESIVTCEHKYWSRVEQSRIAESACPRFGLVDLAEPNPRLPEHLRFPVWLKPVKSASSKLAFRVEDDAGLAEAVGEIRAGIGQVGGPFDAVLERVPLPDEVAEAGAQACLAEEAVSGTQVTVEGYCHGTEPHVYGVIDSVSYPDSSSFLRYRYPSTLSPDLAERVSEVSRTIATGMGLRWTTFDIEFFVDTGSGRVWVLEVNPRLSQSHARLFEHVDGVSNLHCMVSLALGRDPRMPHRRGRYATASKYFLRTFTDGVVRRVPTHDEIAAVEAEVDGVIVEVTTETGTRLSEQYAQDSYSYELADIHIPGDNEAEVERKYRRCIEALRFDIDR